MEWKLNVTIRHPESSYDAMASMGREETLRIIRIELRCRLNWMKNVTSRHPEREGGREREGPPAPFQRNVNEACPIREGESA